MNIRELRFGNIVSINEEVKKELEEEEYINRHFNVVEIRGAEVSIYSYQENIRYKEYQIKDGSLTEIIPIKLVEYWLLKFGFKKYEFENGEPNQYRYKNRLIVIRDGKFTDYGSSVMLEYVHQLQNFYFAHGEELVLQD